jgi:hypothetical protein
MKRLLVVLAAVILCMGADKCKINVPVPRPTSKPPTLPPTTPPTPVATPKPPTPGCPVIEDDDAAVVDQTEQYAPDYASGILALQRKHPDWFAFDEFGRWQAKRAGDQKQYPTPAAVQAFREQFYDELGREFAKSGLCFQTIGDELHVFDRKAQPIVSERYKPFEQGGGREMQKAFMGRTLAIVHGAAPPPTPGPTTPGTPPTSTPPPTGSALCTDDTPDASTFRLSVSWNSSRTVGYVDATPKVRDSVFCPKYNTNPNSQGTCPLRPEGHPAGPDCARKHGLPKWFVNGDPAPECADERVDCPYAAWVITGDPFHVHAPLLSTVKACLAKDLSVCSPDLVVQ